MYISSVIDTSCNSLQAEYYQLDTEERLHSLNSFFRFSVFGGTDVSGFLVLKIETCFELL